MEKIIEQESITKTWNNVWASQKLTAGQDLFADPLFIEGYSVVKKLIFSNPQRILEGGGGSGRYGMQFSRDFPAKVIIVDITDNAVNWMRKTKEEMCFTNVEIQRGDIFNLNFPDNYFDIVFSEGVIEHFSNYGEAIREMARVLRPDGLLITLVPGFWNPHTLYKEYLKICGKKYKYGYEKSFTKKELRKLYLSNNLNIVAEDGFYPAYGILRLKRIHKSFKLLGRICNRSTRFLDLFTNRFFSRNFGFEIVIVGKKNQKNDVD